MSLLSGGRLSGRAKAVATAAFATSLMVYGLIAATPAYAVSACTAIGSTLVISMENANDSAVVFTDTNNQVWTQTNFDPDGGGPGAANIPFNCGAVQLASSLTSVAISGFAGSNQSATIVQYKVGPSPALPAAAAYPGPFTPNTAGYPTLGAGMFFNGAAAWTTTKWTVNLGNDSVGTGNDTLTLDNTLDKSASNVTLGASGIDLDTNGTIDATVSGVKVTSVLGSQFDPPTGSNSINAGGDKVTGAAYAGNLGVSPSATTSGVYGILGNGNDTGDVTAETETGGTGNDFIVGGSGEDVVTGGLGSNFLSGDPVTFPVPGPGAVITPVADPDTTDIVSYATCTAGVIVSLQAGTGLCGGGIDSLVLTAPGSGDSTFERIYGSPQADNLTGDDQPNYIRPDKGDDVVDGLAPGAALKGTTFDRLDYQNFDDGVTVDMNAQTATGTSVGKDTFKNIEGVRGTEGDDTVTDNITQANLYDLEDGNDTIDQGADAATSADADQMSGGPGIDSVNYTDRTDDLNVNLNVGPCGVGGSSAPLATGNGDLSLGENDGFYNPDGCSADIENATLGTGNDTFMGTTQNNTVWPNGGQNVLQGCVTGGTGGTTTTTSVAITSAVEAAAPSTIVTVTTANPHNLLPGQTITISGITPVGYNGTGQVATVIDATHFTYNIAPTTGLAAGGSGVVSTSTTTGTGGGGGACVAGIDTVNYSLGYGSDGVTVNLAGGGPTSGGQDSISGFANAVGSPGPDNIIGTDAVAGTNGANGLKGGKGNDTISGNAGPDSVVGGAGKDNIRLGGGDDTGKGSGGNDHIRGGNGDDNIKGGKGKDKCSGGGGDNIVKCEKIIKKNKSAPRTIADARVQHLVLAVKP